MGLTIINLLAGIAMMAVNGLAMFGKIGGVTPQGVSERYPNVLTPAGWTFSIWSVIYTLILIFLIGSLISSDVRGVAERIGNWFWISCLFNIGWILTWHFGLIWASMIMMLGLLTSLVMIMGRAGGITLFTAGFSLYTGWITVATLANLMVMLVSFGADGFSKTMQSIAISMLIIAALVFASVLLTKKDWVYGAAGVIALAGIGYRQLAPSMLAGKYPLVAAVTIGAFLVTLGCTVYILFVARSTPGKNSEFCEMHSE